MMMRSIIPATFLLLALATPPGTDATITLFDALIPPACVSPQLQNAGFCTIQQGCAERCFARDTSGGLSASTFSLGSIGLSNFYIPNDAVDCDDFEDPICPATKCCPMCQTELNALYRCIIMEGGYDIPSTLPMYCKLDCQGFIGSNTGFIPTEPPADNDFDTNTNSTDLQSEPPVIEPGEDDDFDTNTNSTDLQSEPPVIEPEEDDDFYMDTNSTDFDIDSNETDWQSLLEDEEELLEEIEELLGEEVLQEEEQLLEDTPEGNEGSVQQGQPLFPEGEIHNGTNTETVYDMIAALALSP